jgi:hypothetical protein
LLVEETVPCFYGDFDIFWVLFMVPFQSFGSMLLLRCTTGFAFLVAIATGTLPFMSYFCFPGLVVLKSFEVVCCSLMIADWASSHGILSLKTGSSLIGSGSLRASSSWVKSKFLAVIYLLYPSQKGSSTMFYQNMKVIILTLGSTFSPLHGHEPSYLLLRAYVHVVEVSEVA